VCVLISGSYVQRGSSCDVQLKVLLMVGP
jgi:hypothetical protein